MRREIIEAYLRDYAKTRVKPTLRELINNVKHTELMLAQ